ncbi:alpha/beta hydrolase [Chloroflexota bacterium]
MPQPVHLDPAAYAADGGPIGILLIHGYTGSVAETRPMGQYLAARDLTVRCPLLSGHGTSPQDLTRIQWQAWAGEAESALRDLQSRCEMVFVGGLSLGSLLALWLGAEHATIAGLIPMAPLLKVRNRLLPAALGLRYLLKYDPLDSLGDDDLGDPEAIDRIWCYDEVPLWGAAELYLLQRRVRDLLPDIHQPVLIFQGRRDAQLHPESAQILYNKLASTDKTLVWLESSGHNLLADGERESVWAQSYTWMLALSGTEGPAHSEAIASALVAERGNL